MRKTVDGGKMLVTVVIDVRLTWKTALMIRVMGRYPASIVAQAIADKIREAR